MSQFIIPSSELQKEQFCLRGAEAHHLIHVLRVQPNDAIDLFDGRGRQARGVVLSVEKTNNVVTGRISETGSASIRPAQVHLFQGLPRGSKFDYVIEKATELGVDAIIPFLSQKNSVRLSPEQAQAKLPRWENVIRASAKQCERATLPLIETPRSFDDLEGRLKAGLSLVGSQEATGPSLKDSLKQKPPQLKLVNIVIGPESGFSKNEMTRMREWGVQAVSLGGRVLRSETAGPAFLSILNYEWELD